MRARRLIVVAALVAAGSLVACAWARADPAAELAQRYAPVVRLSLQEEPCASGEAFEPIDVRAIFGDQEVALRGPWDASNLVKVAPAMSDVAGDRHGYALDFPGNPLASSACSYEEWQRRITAGRRPRVYAHVATEDGKLALQYWFFYVFNDFNNQHEGDWEMIQLNFDAPTALAALKRRPFDVGYSQHEGAERAEWGSEKLELVNRTHPVVYPAEGSHANYFSGALFLGSSAATGVGCDNTKEPWRTLRPAVSVVPESPSEALAAFPWLDYHGVWGERRSGFFNGAGGPNVKSQWTKPITWADETWRSKSFPIVGGRSLGPTATTFFCGAVGGASSILTRIVHRPAAAVVVAAVLLTLILWLASRTRWDADAPDELRRPRAWGSLVATAARAYRENVKLFLGIGALFIVLGVVIAGLQYLIFDVSGLSSLEEALGSRNVATDTVVLAFGFVVNLLGLTIVQATCARALVEHESGSPITAARAFGFTARRLGPLLGGLVLATIAVALLDLTLVGLPIAIWLTIRWSLLAQAVALEDASAGGSLRRSGRLVRRHWWRTASFTAFVTGIALALGPLVGTALLFATSASFDVINLVSDVVYAIAIPFAAIATTYLYFDLRARTTD